MKIFYALLAFFLLVPAVAQAQRDDGGFGSSFFTGDTPLALIEPEGEDDGEGVGTVSDAMIADMESGVLANELQGIAPAAGEDGNAEFDEMPWPPELDLLPLPLPLE